MTREKCEKCEYEVFYIESQSVNGGYTAYTICARCGHESELVDTYTDQ